MKKIIALICIPVLLLSCGNSGEQTAFFNTMSGTFGHYTLQEVRWEQAVRLSDIGLIPSCELLHQMKNYGWTGLQYQETDYGTMSATDCNLVIPPANADELAQVNLYLPYFQYTPDVAGDGTETILPPDPVDGQCCVTMDAYQFYYTIDADGRIDIQCPDSPLVADTFPYTDVKVRFTDNGQLLFEGYTTLWDFSSGTWQSGRLTAVFSRRVHQETIVVVHER